MIDIESYHVGASLALRLAGQGHEVTIATPSETVAAWCNWTLEGPRLREQLYEAGVVMRCDVMPWRSSPGAVRLRNAHGGEAFEVEADAVVLVTQRLSDDGALPRARRRPDALAAAGIEAVYRRATAWPRAGSSTRCSTATASPARSTARTRTCTCRPCASAGSPSSAREL